VDCTRCSAVRFSAGLLLGRKYAHNQPRELASTIVGVDEHFGSQFGFLLACAFLGLEVANLGSEVLNGVRRLDFSV